MAYRFERKYRVPESDLYELLQFVKLHPAHFSRSYPPRWVNNLYFDDPAFRAVHENLDGIAKRRKLRLRWYGKDELFKTHLEIKYKQGLVGDKMHENISASFSRNNTLGEILGLLSRTQGRRRLQFASGAYLPTLLNQYQRYYFETPEGIRLTIDQHIAYAPCNRNIKLSEQPFQKSDMLVVEMKYLQEFSRRAAQIAGEFPFRLEKNSKYVNGIDLLYNRVIL